MDKLNLNLDDLNVTSFVADDAPSTSSGTVRGQADDQLEMAGTFTTCDTVDINCGNSCGLYYCDSDQSCGGGFTTIGTIEIEE